MRVRKGERAIAAAAAMAAMGALGMVAQQAQAANDVWVGNTSTSFNASNWTGNNPPVSGDSLEFGVAGTSGLTLSDNLTTPGFLISGITFDNEIAPNAFVINPASPTGNGFTLAGNITDNNTTSVETLNDAFVLNSTPTLAVASGGNLVLGGIIGDGGAGLGLNISGPGSVTLGGASTFIGNINVTGGTLVANLAETSQTNPAFSALGNVQVARNVIIGSGATLVFASSDTLGGNASTTIGTTLQINGGTVTNSGNSFNTLGPVILNGGTLTGTGGSTVNTVPSMYYLRQSVTVTGSTPSTITGTGTNNGYNLVSTGTTFNVAVTNGSGTDLTVSAPLLNSINNVAAGLIKTGAGTMVLSAANGYTGTTTVGGGTLNITGTLGAAAAAGAITVADTSTDSPAIMRIGGNVTSNGTVAVGGIVSGANASAVGAIYQTAGIFNSTTAASTNAFQLGAGPTGYGYYSLSGTGTLDVNEIGIGGGNAANSGAVGVMDITGGTFNDNGWITVARGGGETGILNVTGGTVNWGAPSGAQFSMGLGGGVFTAITNVSNATINTTANRPLAIAAASAAGALGEVNLGTNGVMVTGSVTASATSTSLMNFNGGTLRASIANAGTGFLTSANITGLDVYSGGGTIDNNGTSITINRPFLAPTGSGVVNSIIVSNGGSGYIGAPAVVFSGDGVGAAGYATINQTTGAVTGIVVTNPGTGYTTASITFQGGGGSGAAAGTISLTPNASGGLTFTGNGTTTISNAATVLNTYTGSTQITGGTVLLSGAGSLNSTSVININGATAKLLQTSTTAVTAPIMVTKGTLDGTTILGSVTLANSPLAIINTGNGAANAGATQLTMSSLTFAGGTGTINLKTSPAGMGAGVAPGLITTATNGLITNAGTPAPLNITYPAIEWADGVYNLIGYQGAIGGAGFVPGVVSPAFGGRLVGTVGNSGNSGGNVSLTISGFYDIWAGVAAGGKWTTAAGNQNFVRSDTNAAIDYVANDTVLFDDTPGTVSGTTAVVISDNGGVSASNVTFNNTTSNYTFTSTATGNVGLVSGSLIKSGTGTVTMNTVNSYSGGATLNAGMLNMGTSSVLGTGTLTLAGGGFDNTSGLPMSLATNVPIVMNGGGTFGGTNALSLGTGAVTLNATSTITTNGTAPLTIAGAISDGGAGLGFTKAGVGTLSLSGAENYNGATNVTGGLLNFGGSLSTQGTVNVGTVAAGNASLVMASGSSITILGPTVTTQVNMTAGAAGYGAITVPTGASASISGFFVDGITTSGAIGIWNINGGSVSVVNNFGGTIGATAGTTGVLNITAGSYNSVDPTSGGPSGIYVGESGTGILNVSGTGVANLGGQANGTGDLNVGRNSGATGTVNLGAVGAGGGTINTTRVQKTGATAVGTFNFHGGTLKALPAASATFFTGLTNAYVWNEGGTIDNSGLNLTIGQALLAPVAGTGVTTLSVTGGTGYMNTPFVTVTGGTVAAGGLAATAVANINYATGQVTGVTITNPGNYSSTTGLGLTFSGGGGTAPTLSTFTTSADTGGALTLIGTGTTTLSGANTYSGGTIDSLGGLNINNATALGTGTFTLNSGPINNSSGAAITMTANNPQNWNTDVSFAGGSSLIMGTGAVTINATRTVTVGANTLSVGGIGQTASGFGLIKAGAGTFGITGASTYSGATSVTAGALILSGAGSVNGSTGVTITGGAKLVQNSSAAGTVPVILTAGTVDGTGTLSSMTVADASTNVINHGGGLGQGALTINNLSFSGAATLNFSTSAAVESSARLVTTTLSSNGNGSSAKDLINISTTDPSFANGTYDLIQYSGTIGGAGFGGFVKEATVPGVGARQSAVLNNDTAVTPHEIELVVSGVFPIWTGQASSNWTTVPIGTPFNWTLSGGGGSTEFQSGDTVQFDDNATGTTTVNVADATVNPTATTFANNNKNYVLQSTGGFGITSGALIKSGTGTLTITNVNTYSGNTTMSAGTLNINNAAAIGTGNLNISGGSIDNTSGGPISLSTNNPQNWNGDFSFGGSNSLTMGTGAITLGANRVLTINGSSATPLTEGGAIGDGGNVRGITQTGPGTLILNGASTFTGGYTINSGVVIAGSNAALGAATSPLTITTSATVEPNGHALSVGSLTGDTTATISNSSATAGSIIVHPTGSSTYQGVLADGSLGGALGFTMSGSGTETISGSNSYTGVTTVTAGTLNLTGTIAPSATLQSVVIGSTANSPSVMTISGGSLSTNAAVLPASQFTSSIVIGLVAGSIGDLQMSSGTLNNAAQFGIGFGAGSYSAYTQTGGTATSGSYIVVGFNNDQAVYNQSGGSMTVSSNVMTVAAGGTGAIAVANFSGNASFTSTNGTSGGLYVGEVGTGTMNVSGSAVITLADQGLILGRTGTGSNGMLNLLGGTINTNTVTRGAGTGFVNFNGGTLQANTANANLMTGMSGAFVYQGGAIIDTNGQNISLSQPLLAPSGSGVQSVAFGSNGTGYKDIPLVSFIGGTLAAGGAPASGVATLNYSTGQVTGVQITNPGNYTVPPTGVSFTGGGGAAPAVSAVNSATNIGGGLTKVGSGILALTGTTPHTYTGPTLVNQGTLRVVNAAQPVANYNFNTDPNTGSFLENSALNSAGVLDPSLNGTDFEGAAQSVSVVGTAGPNGKLPPNPATTNALKLDGLQGQNAAVVISNPITDLSSAASWSVSLWVQTSVVGATLFGKDTDSTWTVGNSAFYLGDQNGAGNSEPTAVRNSGGWISGDTNKLVSDGNWHYVTYTDNGTTKAIYLDGTLEALSQTAFNNADVGDQVELGFTPDTAAFPADGNTNMQGMMTDLQFYNVGLSAAQVSQLFTTNTLSSSTSLGLLPATTPVTLASQAVVDLTFGQTIGSLTSTATDASVIVESGVLGTGNDNTNTTFAGVISGSGGLGKLGTGTFTLTGVNTYSGDTSVTGGKLIVAATGLLPTTTNLTANNGTASFAANPGTGILAIGLKSVTSTGATGLVTLGNAAATSAPNVNSNRTVLVLGSNITGTPGALVTTAGGKVDLGSNDAIVSGGGTAVGVAGTQAVANAAQVYSELGSGRGANGLWTSSGISSSSVAAKPSLMALGMEFNDTHSIGTASVSGGVASAPSGTPITTMFDGQTVADGDVLVKYTYVGDADLSGRVGASDYVLIDNAFNFNKTAVGTKISGWVNGDFNYDGLINGDDYTLIDNAFNTQGSTVSFAGGSAGPAEMIATNTDQIAGSSSSAVPEPTTMSLLGIGAVGLLSRRRRKARTQ